LLRLCALARLKRTPTALAELLQVAKACANSISNKLKQRPLPLLLRSPLPVLPLHLLLEMLPRLLLVLRAAKAS
jgi:hypothetical protein